MDIRKLCIHCMHEKPQADGICPHCGSAGNDYTPQPNHLPPMTPLNGKYLLGKVLGQGGFGITYIALDTHLQVPVAIKELYLKNINQRGADRSVIVSSGDRHIFEENRKRFLQEARVLAMFNEQDNEGIVNVRDHFEENGTAYIVMEYLNGITLKKYVKQKGKLSLEEAKAVIDSVGHALMKIHEFGVIHKDVGPDNIMVLKGGKVKLLDFGGATNMYQKETGDIISFKRGYAPPEQYMENGRIGPWTDIYALAATMYFCLTGNKPTDAMERKAGKELKHPSKCGAKINDKLETVLMTALELQPNMRYRSVEEFLNALNPKIRRGGRRGLIAGIAAVVVLLLVLILGGNSNNPRGGLLKQLFNPLEPGDIISMTDGTYIFESYLNQEIIMGIDSGFGDDGARLLLKAYKESNRNRITLTQASSGPDSYWLNIAHTGSTLMPKGGTSEPGNSIVQLSDPLQNNTDKWYFIYCGKEDGREVVILKNTAGYALAPEGGLVQDGVPLVLAKMDLTDDSQKWYLSYNKKNLLEPDTPVYHPGDLVTTLSGVYTLKSCYDNNSMWSVSSYAALEEPELIVWENVWDETQHFRFELVGKDMYRIYPVKQAQGENKCLEFDEQSGKVVVRNGINTSEQMFHVVYSGYNVCKIQAANGDSLGYKASANGQHNGHVIWVTPDEEFTDSKLAMWMLSNVD